MKILWTILRLWMHAIIHLSNPTARKTPRMNPEGSRLHCCWECKSVQPLWKTVWSLLGKVKLEPPYDPEIPLLGTDLNKILIQKDTCIPMSTAALFPTTKRRKPPQCPLTDEWVKKMWCIYTMEYYSAVKKNEIMPFATTQVQPKITIWSEVSQKKKDKYHMISLTCEIENMAQRNLMMQQKPSHRHREQAGGYQVRGRWGREGLGGWDEQTQTTI